MSDSDTPKPDQAGEHPVPPAPPAPPVPPAQPTQPAPSYGAPAYPQQPAPGYQATPPPGAGYGQTPPPGYPPQQPPQQQPYYNGYSQAPAAPPMNTLAIITIILAFVFSIAGIVTGHIALKQIDRTGEQGRGLAKAGLILSYVFTGLGVLAVIAYIVFIVVIVAAAGTSGYYSY